MSELVSSKCVAGCGTIVWIRQEHQAYGVICDECIAKEQREQQLHRRAQELLIAWEQICPPMYRDTILERLPMPELTKRVLQWPFIKWKNVSNGTSVGVNLWGFPRTGKTRTLFLLLRRAHFAGKRIKFFGPSQFAQECEVREFKTGGWIKMLCGYDIVAFDDVDKCKLSRPQEDKFFALFNERLARHLPTFFTGNTKGSELQTFFRHGEAIVARIREHSYCVHFPQPKGENESKKNSQSLLQLGGEPGSLQDPYASAGSA